MNQEQVQKDGANARALGRDLLTNPYYVASGMPSVTGERLEEWHAKAVAWAAGWHAEDLVRAGAGAPAAQNPQPRMTASEALERRELPMTLERARAIVTEVEDKEYLKLRDGGAALDGYYTAEQLEAIALVLRADGARVTV
jgi:hypothetical protein